MRMLCEFLHLIELLHLSNLWDWGTEIFVVLVSIFFNIYGILMLVLMLISYMLPLHVQCSERFYQHIFLSLWKLGFNWILSLIFISLWFVLTFYTTFACLLYLYLVCTCYLKWKLNFYFNSSLFSNMGFLSVYF